MSLAAAAQSKATVATLFNWNETSWSTLADSTVQSIAGFGQATPRVTPKCNVTGGFRMTHETKDESVWLFSRFPAPPVVLAALASAAVPAISVSIGDTGFSFRAGTHYRCAPEIMANALISGGGKAGGLNTALPGVALGGASLARFLYDGVTLGLDSA